jgi:hypothetical protein
MCFLTQVIRFCAALMALFYQYKEIAGLGFETLSSLRGKKVHDLFQYLQGGRCSRQVSKRLSFVANSLRKTLCAG